MKSLEIMRSMMVPAHYHRFAEKSWGFEYWFENNKQYCGKIIQVRQNEWSSFGAFHYHKIKDETFLVLDGRVLLDILDLTHVSKLAIEIRNRIHPINKLHQPWVNRYCMEPFNYIRLRPGVLHRFSSLEKEAIFTETSTTHREDDSYRIGIPDAKDQLNEFAIDHIHGQINFPANTEKFSYLEEK